MKARVLGIALGVLVAAQASAEPIVIKFGSTAPPRAHLNKQVFAPWAERVTKASGGTLKVEFIPGSVLGRVGQMVERVKQGVADIGFDLQGAYAGKYPLSEVVSLPFVWDKSSNASVALWRLIERGVIKEYDDFVPINIFAFTNSVMMMRSEATTLASMKGKKIIASSKMRSRVTTAIGATPVSVLIHQTYQALNRGVVSGGILPFTAVQPFRLQEVATHYIDVPLGAAPGFVFMNKKKFASLPPQAQKVIADNSGEAFVAAFGKFWDKVDDQGRQIVLKANGKIVTPKGAELEKWRKATGPVVETWTKELPKGAAVLKAFRAELEKVKAGK